MLKRCGGKSLCFLLSDWKVPDLTGFGLGHPCLFRQVLGSVAMRD